MSIWLWNKRRTEHMKRLLDFILMLAASVGAYIPCRELAIIERGNEFLGGEMLVPVLMIVVWMMATDWRDERSNNG
jgi:hypothetical protein